MKTAEDLDRELHRLASGEGKAFARGQSDAAWRLQPSIDRNIPANRSPQDRAEEEQALLEDFANDAIRFLGPLEQNYLAMRSPGNYLPVASVMQHFGAPTRLLDWTFSPWVAAYFAVIDDWDRDGAIWWFSCREYQPAMERQWRRLGWRTTGENPDNPIAKAFDANCPEFIAQAQLGIPFERASAQQAVFTVAAPLGCFHDEVFAKVLDHGKFGRIVIPAGMKMEVEHMLYTMNIHAKSLQHARADYEGFKMHGRRGARA